MCAIGPPNDVSPSFRNAAKTSAGVPRRTRSASFSPVPSATEALRSCIARASRDERDTLAAEREAASLGSRDHDADRFLHGVVAAALRPDLDRARGAAKLETYFGELAVFVAQARSVVLVEHERRFPVSGRRINAELPRALV